MSALKYWPQAGLLLGGSFLFCLLLWSAGSAGAQGVPAPAPVVYSGAVTVGGSPAPDGLQIVARIRDYESEPTTTSGGSYASLTVGPADGTYLNRQVTFHILAGPQTTELQATEADLFFGGPAIKDGYNLSFQALTTPTSTPTATPTPTTGTPPPAPVVYSGAVTVGGSPAPDGLQIVARIRDYESEPRTTSGGSYANLTVGPADGTYLNRQVTFHILAGTQTGELQAGETDLFFGGPAIKDGFNLSFPGAPTPTATPSPTLDSTTLL